MCLSGKKKSFKMESGTEYMFSLHFKSNLQFFATSSSFRVMALSQSAKNTIKLMNSGGKMSDKRKMYVSPWTESG